MFNKMIEYVTHPHPKTDKVFFSILDEVEKMKPSEIRGLIAYMLGWMRISVKHVQACTYD